MFAQATEAKLEFANKYPERPYLLTLKIQDMLYIGHETLNFWLTNEQVDAILSTAHAPVMRARAERSTPGLYANG
ncbi:MAG: hypothetical protein E6R03_06190 [Hyphomicrobiaceae bacterium]|nr:MAG: hypothetical protein E6R03_06190 [Hyphomicrobiaceae bacterium]